MFQMSRLSVSIPTLSLLTQNDTSETLRRKYFSSVFHFVENQNSKETANARDEAQNLLSSSCQPETRKLFSRSSTLETCETILRWLFLYQLLNDEQRFFSIPTESLDLTNYEVNNETSESQGQTNFKSMRSMSRSTFDSIIDEFIEDDWEKRSAFGVSLTAGVNILCLGQTIQTIFYRRFKYHNEVV